MDTIKEKLKLLPKSPGCYLMKNEDNVVIYVGKAKNLKNRVTSYFRGEKEGKTKKLVSEIKDFEYILVESETESFVLELNLIKKYSPKYNILLKDDKTYPYIELTNEEVPRLNVVRYLSKKKNKNNLYGPFPNVKAAKATVQLLNRMYPLRKCTHYEKKLCLYYSIHECLGYCHLKIEKEVIDKMKNEIKEFLNGNDDNLKRKIKKEMEEAANFLNFEKAKELKDILDFIDVTLVKQKVETKDIKDRDVFGTYIYKEYIAIQIFFIRSGKIVGRHFKILPLINEKEEMLENYLYTFYQKHKVPSEIIIEEIEKDALEKALGVKIKTPQKGVFKKLLDLAILNAKEVLVNNFDMVYKTEEKTIVANEELRRLLGLKRLDRIEIFDNSNLFGSFNVSGMVVFENGVPNKNEYRKYKILEDKNDDYNTMKEVTYRRYYKVLMEDLKRPDLIIADGGIGQVNAIKEVLNSLSLDILVVGLKKNERHATEALIYENKELLIDKRSNLFYLLERMQDEVHNYTISYHKKIRSKGSISSILDMVEGIGPKRREMLLKRYKTISKMKAASKEELSSIVGEKVALTLFNFLQNDV